MILECFYHEKGKDKLTNQKHCHEDCYEIIQTLSKDGNFMIKDTLYPIDYGTIFLINAIDPHCSIPKNANEYTRNKIALSRNTLDSMAELLGCSDIIQSLFMDNNCATINLAMSELEQVDALFHNIVNLYEENSTHSRMELYSNILHLLHICFNNQKRDKQKTNDDISRALIYINDNIINDISLEQISKALFMNKSYLCRQFKKATGMTVIEYIKNRRLSMAKKKLQFTDLSISNIAFVCGFSNFSQFSTFFKKSEGITPTQYREKYRK